MLRLHYPRQGRFQNGIIRQRREKRLPRQAESQFAVHFDDRLGLAGAPDRAVPTHGTLWHAQATTNNLTGYQFSLVLSGRLIDDLELDCLPLVQREQHLL